ncbi:MAG TPA: PEP-CTERM sorting domain-containing protein [Terriglobales bacterium]|nr:PEP-CTERM sorting domain-containing protein [Terriglobales bacterium]
MTAQRQWLSACIWGGYLRSLQRFRNGTSRAAAACFFALALSSVASAQTLSCPVSSDVTVSSTLFNDASSCTVDFGVTLTIGSTGDLVNSLSKSGILQNNGTFLNNGDFENNFYTFTNFGTVFNDNTMDIGTFTNAGIFDNFGTITDASTDGTLNNASVFTNDGFMTLFDTVNNSVGAQFNNAGFLSLGSTFAAPLQATNNGTFTNFTGGDLEIVTPFTNNGSLINDGTLGNGNAAGTAIPTFINNGTITNNGTFTNGASVPKGFGSLFASVSNNGKFDNFNTLAIYNAFDNNAGASVINEAGATLTIDAAGFTNDGSLTNNGSLTLVSGNLGNFGSIVNNRSITNNGGSLFISSGGTLTNAAGSTFLQTAGTTEVEGTLNSVPAVQIQGGTLLGLGGTINGNVNNTGGIVEPGNGLSALSINGNYTQGSSGAMTIQLAGASQFDFDVLDVSGLASLDGTVDFTTVGGFTPLAGDDFTFLLFGSLSGNFTNIDFTNWTCPTGDSCTEVLGANSLSLDITGPQTAPTPEPSSLLLLGTGILVIARFFRWKRVQGAR